MNMHILLSSVHFVLYRALFAHMAVFVHFSLEHIPYNRKLSHGTKFRGFRG